MLLSPVLQQHRTGPDLGSCLGWAGQVSDKLLGLYFLFCEMGTNLFLAV